MTSPNKIVSFPNQLETIEADAQSDLDKSIQHFKAFVAKINLIQDSALWQKEYGTWANYLKQRWNMAESTFRAKRLNSEIADMIAGVVTVTTETEISHAQANTIRRRLSKLAPNDVVLKAEIYARAYQETGKIVPSERELAIAHEAITDVKDKRIYEYDGIQYDADNLFIDANIKQAISELHAAKKAHIDESYGITSKRLEISEKGAIEAIFQALGVSVPDSIQNVAISWREALKED